MAARSSAPSLIVLAHSLVLLCFAVAQLVQFTVNLVCITERSCMPFPRNGIRVLVSEPYNATCMQCSCGALTSSEIHAIKLSSILASFSSAFQKSPRVGEVPTTQDGVPRKRQLLDDQPPLQMATALITQVLQVLLSRLLRICPCSRLYLQF